MELGRGTITFRIIRATNAQVEIDTPSVSIRPAQIGVYRVTVTDDGITYITPRSGQIEVFTPKGFTDGAGGPDHDGARTVC